MTTKRNRYSVLQIAYYPSLLHTRQIMMENDGHLVTSVLGNTECKTLATAKAFDVVLIGFSGKLEQRREIIRWLKDVNPQLPIVALSTQSEELPQADYAMPSDDPKRWLAAVRDSCRRP